MKRNVKFFLMGLLCVCIAGCREEQALIDEGITNIPVMTSVPTLTESPIATSTPIPTVTMVPSSTPEPTSSPIPTSIPTPEPTVTPMLSPTPIPEEKFELTEQQRNSFSMLYYLAITAEEIRLAKDNRLMLDEIYTVLLNDINPGAIDETTQDHLRNLRDIIKSYRGITVKRERIQYIHNQNKAAEVRRVLVNPLTVLSKTKSFDWKDLVFNISYSVADSFRSNKLAEQAAEQSFILSGWELDDDELETIQKNRERAFDYMVDIVQEYGLDGKLTLNEKAIETFAEIKGIESVQQKTRRLELEENTYKLFGDYWLELAEWYYEINEFENCLMCVEKYKELASEIYRKDMNYARILPKAIAAAQETYTGTEYVRNVERFAKEILENTDDRKAEEWATRYFVAQVYLDLYARTTNREYLKMAYGVVEGNVTVLVAEQLKLNKTYIDDVVEVTLEDLYNQNVSEDEKKEYKEKYEKELKEYNEEIKEKRKTELPPIYEPLALNCELLFALADKLDITQGEKEEIEAILQSDSNGVFLSKPVNDRYSFDKRENNYSIEFGKEEIIIPVRLLSDGAKIIVKIIENEKTVVYRDYQVEEVERPNDDIESFCAHMTSKLIENQAWTENTKAVVEIYNGNDYEPLTFSFKVKEYKDRWLIPDKVVFENE